MTTIYRADDGREFTNHFDCEEYEFHIYYDEMLKKCGHEIHAYKGETELDMSFENAEQTYNEVETLVIETERAVKFLQELYPWYGFEYPEEVGTYYYDTKRDKFVKKL